MIKRATLMSIAVTAACLAIAASRPAVAQSDGDQKAHHSPAVTVTAPPDAKPGPSQSPKSGMAGGKMDSRMMMGPGMMDKPGMMGGCPMMGMMMQGGEADAHSKGRTAFLRAELGITEAQENVWDAYAAALEKNLQGMRDMRQIMKKAMVTKSSVERLDAHISAMEGRLAALKEIKPALANLYTALSEDQKKKTDKLLTEMGCMM